MPENDQSPVAPDASADTAPVSGGVPDLDSLSKSLVDQFDKRFSGFQSLVDRKIDGVNRAVNELKTAGLSPEEREQFESGTRDEEMKRLITENAMLKLSKDQPEAVSLFSKIMEQESLEDQLAVIQEALGTKAADHVEQALADAGEPETQALGIDANNPPRTKSTGLGSYVDGQPMTAELADAILKGVGNQRGALVASRRG